MSNTGCGAIGSHSFQFDFQFSHSSTGSRRAGKGVQRRASRCPATLTLAMSSSLFYLRPSLASNRAAPPTLLELVNYRLCLCGAYVDSSAQQKQPDLMQIVASHVSTGDPIQMTPGTPTFRHISLSLSPPLSTYGYSQ